MIKEFNEFLNEKLTNKELAEDLKDAKFINVDFIGGDSGWGVAYYKDGKQYVEGNFNTNAEVHEFLIDNNIDYAGKGGFLNMKRFRANMDKGIPYPAYQNEIITKGIKDML